ncbi:MAG TPA: VCBS repeat-containing protein, partial [Verrucomicrobiae bacterium]
MRLFSLRCAAACILLLIPSLFSQEAPFTRVTTEKIITLAADSTGVSWTDYDGDGYLDVFVSTFETPRFFLYRNNHDESFSLMDVVITSPTDLMQAEGCIWADFDNDGDPDLFISVGLGGNDLLYRNDGNGVFTKLTNIPPTQSGGNSRGCAWADYDNDGWVDLFVANEKSQTNFLFHNDAGAGLMRVTTGAIVTDRGNSYGCAWGDYDNDGLQDLVVANNGSRNFLYHNEGNGIFTKITNSAIVTNIASSAGVAWGDYDNDGFLDLFVANLGQRNFLYHNNGDGTFTLNRNTAIGQETTYSWSGAWADFDNDGHLDLFVANGQPNGTGLKDFLYRNRGDGTFEKLT